MGGAAYVLRVDPEPARAAPRPDICSGAPESLERDQPASERARDGLCPIDRIELLEDAVDAHLDRADGEPEGFRDLAVAQAVGHEGEDLSSHGG